MKLSEYKYTNKKEINNKNNIKDDIKNKNTDNNKNNINDLYDEYKNMNNEELYSTLIKNVEKQKKDGSFNFEEIQNSCNNILPFLNNEQKNAMLTLLNKLK